MGYKTFLFIFHLVATALSLINAINASDNVDMILWVIAAVCWNACAIMDIVDVKVDSRLRT